MLVSITRYQSITGDTTSASAVVEAALLDAQMLLEWELRRGLETRERTERMRIFPDGRVYPSATPITGAPDGSTVAGVALIDAGPPGSFMEPPDAYVSVTYTGGFDPAETDRAEVTYVPVEIQRAIAWAAYALIHPVESSAPGGATSVTVGDVSVSYGANGSPSPGEVQFDSSLVSRWRHRTDGAA